MSYIYLQEREEEFSAVSYSDIPVSVLSKLTHFAETFYLPDSETGFYLNSQSGMMSPPLTADPGAEKSMSSVEGSPVRILAQQERELESQEKNRDYGPRWHESFARFNLHTALWKTAQCLLLGDLELYSETWPRWGMMLDGECMELTMLEPHITENESGYWLTPKASDTGTGENQDTFLKRMGDRSDKCAGSLAAQVNQPKTWPTPRSCSAMSADLTEKMANHKHDNLEVVIAREYWATPRASDYKGSGPVGSKSYKHMLARDYLCAQVEQDGDTTPQRPKLSPLWVEWLMGWPIGWTDLKPLEMAKFQQWQRMHGIN